MEFMLAIVKEEYEKTLNSSLIFPKHFLNLILCDRSSSGKAVDAMEVISFSEFFSIKNK
jgi:hypothetical protein